MLEDKVFWLIGHFYYHYFELSTAFEEMRRGKV